MLKIKTHRDCNYHSVFNRASGTTLRFQIDKSKPILPLKHPEILDLSFNSLCYGNCSFCYTSAIPNGTNYNNILEKIKKWFEPLSLNDRPNQVAIGGGGEPTLHPDFIYSLALLDQLEIMPNYTTNAMHLTDKIVEWTKVYCGGVAISTHPHLEKYWRKGIERFTKAKIRTNLHIIVGQDGSVDQFYNLYNEYKDVVDYFVALPYQASGRAKEINAVPLWDLFFDNLKGINNSKVAVGALFYPYLLKVKDKYNWLKLSIYEPECMSGYVMFDTDEFILRKSSYDLRPKFDTSQLKVINNV